MGKISQNSSAVKSSVKFKKSKKRFPQTLRKDLLLHYQEIHFRSKAEFLSNHKKQQLEGIVCHQCNSIFFFLTGGK